MLRNRCNRVASALPRAGLALALAALPPACGAPPERGYFAPSGVEFGNQLATYREEAADVVLDLACQGTYVDRVSGLQVLTVHLQLDVTRPRSGDLVVPRDGLIADVRVAPDQPRLALRLSEAWSGRQRIDGDLVIPEWSLRPFDLFFDSAELVADGPPESVLLRWEARSVDGDVTGQCLFDRIPAGDKRLPGDAPMQDLAFGIRNGYYLPGRLRMGVRALRPSDDQRLHYIFHDPGSWQW